MTKKSDAESGDSQDITGINYLSRKVKGSERLSLEQKVAFAKAIEKGFAVGRRLQFMFDLRDAVTRLQAVTVPKPSEAIEFDQADPVLRQLDEAGEAAKKFIDACGPLLALLPQLSADLDKINTFLTEHEVIASNARSLTERQLVGIAIARTEKALKTIRLEPKEVVEFFKDIDLFDGEGPDAEGWKDILWKSRGRTDETGKTMSEKNRGTLLSDLEFAAEKKAQSKKDEGQ